jgi:aminomethyltransferase
VSEGERRTALLAAHISRGAKLTRFAGWQMPLQYTGVIAEHNAVRNDVGVFDVSHLGKLRVGGARAGDALQVALTADTDALEPGRATYSLVLTEDGGCIDDVFVYRLGHDEWMVVPNAANVGAVGHAIRSAGGDPVDEWERWAILAIQGPRSFEAFESAFPGSGALELNLHAWCPIDVFGHEGLVARTGYTGERGFELYAPAPTATRAFDRIIDAGATAVGLGARDTLRLEMGYALYGHELALDVNPLEVGLGWVLAWDTPFSGRDACLKVKEAGPDRRLFGIVCKDRGVPRQGYAVTRDDQRVGDITSGNHSPTLGTGIALALGPRATAPEVGTSVHIDARGRLLGGDIVKPPFVKRRGTGVDK